MIGKVADPLTSGQIIEKLEKIQKRAARFATGNYTLLPGNTQNNMIRLGLQPLEERRAKAKLHIFFKARHDLVDIPMDHLKLNPRRPCAYAIPTSNLDCHLYSFYPNTVRLWNSLPDDCKQAKTADMFKNRLHPHVVRSAY